ncbi:MAG: TetR/AcrR family transcriptional regulator [Anaerolineales bacterium]|nr:TetR/AcrR family transcriptional regulator [Anaerolineales bacterium]
MSFLNPSPAPDTRDRILSAAVKVFSTKGYHDTKVDEIVEESDTSKGAVYFHFPSKQRIFLAIVEEFTGLLEKKLLEAIEREPDGVRRVNAALQIGLETFGKYRSIAKIFLVQASGLGQTFEETRLDILARFAAVIKGYLDQAVAEGDIPPLDTEVASYAWIGAINEVVIRWVHTGQPEPERVLPTLRTILLRSIGVSEDRIHQLEQESAR